MTDCIDKPQLVVPDSSKLDVPRLLSDIPKYKAWVSPSAWKDWEMFLQDVDQLTLVPDVPWNMDKLISTAITSNAARITCASRSDISEDLLQILAKTSTVPAKVLIIILSVLLYIVDILCTVHTCKNVSYIAYDGVLWRALCMW